MMLSILIFLFFTISVSSLPPKHIYVPSRMSWIQAQANCRKLYTDLSPITSAEVDALFKQSAGQYSYGWIGLYRDMSTIASRWMWSGAGCAKYTNVQSHNYNYKYGMWTKTGWWTASERHWYPSFCFNLFVIDQKMSWEDALTYCRGHHSELTSLLSETETQLALSDMQSDHISQKVWIGLRFLEDQWMWVSGDPLNYTAWAQGNDITAWHCPARGRCGALNKNGVWKDWDCNEKLNFICY